MTETVIPVGVLVAVTLVCFASFRRLSTRIRLLLDALCFAAISGYLLYRGISPVFPPLSGEPGAAALSLRVVGGSWWFVGSRLAVATLWFAIHRNRNVREARLFSDLSAAGIYVATVLIVLNSVFALPVTGVVATSGVVAIMLGLALQNTLADVFSGIAVGIEGPFRVGDRIQLNDRLEGCVVDVNWRSIRIATDGDDLAIIPNSVVAKADIVNRSFPNERRAASVELSCPDCAMPERVIETLMHATLLCPSILSAPSPSAVIVRLGLTRNFYKIGFHVAVTSELAQAKDTLLRVARRQLHYAGLLDDLRRGEPVGLDCGRTASTAWRLLRDVVLLEALTDDQITALSTQLSPRRLEPGESLFNQGGTDQTLHVIASGVIEFIRRRGDVDDTLGCMGAGEYVGEIGLLTGAAHAATATALTHSLVLSLPREALAPLLQQNAELVTAFDRSARKGLDILQRTVASRAAPEIGAPGQLLTRIRGFLGLAAA